MFTKSSNPFHIYLKQENANETKGINIKLLPSQIQNMYDQIQEMEGDSYKQILDLLDFLSKFVNQVTPHNNNKEEGKILDLLNGLGQKLIDFNNDTSSSDEIFQSARTYSKQCITGLLIEMKNNNDKLYTVYTENKNTLKSYLEPQLENKYKI